jgi:hypothetical protein
MPLAMTFVVLRYSDPIAIRWGPWALGAGPVVYFVVKWFGKRAGQQAAKAE